MRELKNILLVEDEDDIRMVGKLSLEAVGGFTVHDVSSGKEAVAAVDTVQPDMVLLDVMMPEMDGVATLRLLQEKGLISTIPVVFMTAKVQPAEISEYLAMGAAGVIPKPFDPMGLPAKVSEIWQEYHNAR